MGYQEELVRLQEAKASMRQSIINKGVEVPEEAKIEEYPDYIAQIVGGGYNPNDPTLEGLKAAIDAGDYEAFPIGTEIPDSYDGNDNPLIVAQYLDGSSDAYKDTGGNNAEGVILVRKYVEPVSQIWNSNRTNYPDSAIRYFLMGDYYNKTSNNLRAVLSEIVIQSYTTNGNLTTTAPMVWFLMSAYEVYNSGNNKYEGVVWDYWKWETGLTMPDAINIGNSGRILKDREGTARAIWLRTIYSSSAVCFIATNGSVSSAAPSTSLGVLPACFIARGGLT